MHPALAIALSYVSGSIPSAYLAGKSRGIDLRQHGSGNLGATNVFRVLGAKIGALVFLVDMAKGALPVLLLPSLTTRPAGLAALAGDWALTVGILCGVAAIVGHVRPVFLLFGRGGKGVATAAGVFLALAPLPAVAALAAFALVFGVSRYVSLGSLVASVVLPLAILATQGASPLFVLAVLIMLFVFWTHRANIGRLRRGEEHRFGGKAAT